MDKIKIDYERPLVSGERIEVQLGDRIGTRICGYLYYRTEYCLVINSFQHNGTSFHDSPITLTAEELKGASIRRLNPEYWTNLETIAEHKR
ncbi:MAG: hypothetical protein QME12_08720 [Nanoarchaeota archaeon]|nr:hypothetical protein [Nanoarchaeota archaeon]